MDEIAERFGTQLQFRDQLIQKEKQKKEHEEQQQKKLRELKDEHELFCLQKSYELPQLQTELEEDQDEILIWKQKWKHIQETASKKKVEMGQIKIATFELYETTGDFVGTEGVAIDTKKQLDQIKRFILDISIVKLYVHF